MAAGKPGSSGPLRGPAAAAWDVRRGQVFGGSEPKGGIAPFDRLVWQVMTKERWRPQHWRSLDWRDAQ